MKVKTNNQKNALIKRRNTSLENVSFLDPGFSCQGEIGEFIGLYIRCELCATRLQHYYQKDKQYKKSKLNTNMLSSALQCFDISLDKEILLLLFKGGEGKRGSKSARQLRNGYLHKLSESDRNEILIKHINMTTEMKKFLKKRIRGQR